MPFHSIQYLLFLPVVVVVSRIVPSGMRWLWLLAASYFFYAAWRPVYLLLILVSTLVDYVAALRIAAAARPLTRRVWLASSLLVNLAILFVFKYAGFARSSLIAAGDMLGLAFALPERDLLLPLGISFYTFQTMGYTIDVFRGDRQPERHAGRLALFVAFFPQLVAGPIERSRHLLPQLSKLRPATLEQLGSGLRRIVFGLFKKLVIADWLARTVDTVFASPSEFHGPAVLLACYAFGFQVYCDFSAYTDIAIGSARLLGVDVMENFRSPYLACSPRDFWRRWHVSLSTWFRDYLYRPLGGNRVCSARWVFNIAVVFLLAGLWHGAAATFVLWGGYHALLLLGGRSVRRLLADRSHAIRGNLRVLRLLGWAVTFHAVTIGWVLFRAADLTAARTLLAGLFSMPPGGIGAELSVLWGRSLWIAMSGLALLGASRIVQARASLRQRWECCAPWIRVAAFYALAAATLVLGRFGTKAFIYFQF